MIIQQLNLMYQYSNTKTNILKCTYYLIICTEENGTLILMNYVECLLKFMTWDNESLLSNII